MGKPACAGAVAAEVAGTGVNCAEGLGLVDSRFGVGRHARLS
jgi:hypothetical protein